MYNIYVKTTTIMHLKSTENTGQQTQFQNLFVIIQNLFI